VGRSPSCAARLASWNHDASPQPATAIDDNALALAKTLRDAYQAWVYRDGRDPDEEVWISTELLLKGIFGFVAPTIVSTLNLDEHGAETVTRHFAQALAATIQRRRRATPEGTSDDEADDRLDEENDVDDAH